MTWEPVMPALEVVEFSLPDPPAGLAIEPVYSPTIEPVRIEPVRWAGQRFNPPGSLWTPEPVAPVWFDAASYDDALRVIDLMALQQLYQLFVDPGPSGGTPPYYYNIGAATINAEDLQIDTIAPTMEVRFPAVPGAVGYDLYVDNGMVSRHYRTDGAGCIEIDDGPDWWEDRWDGRDAGPGMLIEELLDDSTLEYIRRREARERR